MVSFKSKDNKCLYQHQDGCCNRIARVKGYCTFHSPLSATNRVDDNLYFMWLYRLIKKKDTDWRGFIFPKDIKLKNVTIPITINANYSKFKDVNLENVTFSDEIYLMHSVFAGDVNCSFTQFLKSLTFNQSIFNKKCFLLSFRVEERFLASQCRFKDDFYISGLLKGPCNLYGSVFDQQVKFAQFRHEPLLGKISITSALNGSLTLTTNSPTNIKGLELLMLNINNNYKKAKSWYTSKIKLTQIKIVKSWNSSKVKAKQKLINIGEVFPYKRIDTNVYWLFSGQANLQHITFNQPDRVVFTGVKLNNVLFSGTDLREVIFIGNRWYNKELKRNALVEEIHYRNSQISYGKRKLLPSLEYTYRNIRFALEASKDFASANDFFIGEMDAKRRQLSFFGRHFFSVDALYNIVSKYGTSPFRCFVWFLMFTMLHIVLISSQINLENDGLYEEFFSSLSFFYDEISVSHIEKVINSTCEIFSSYINFESIVYSFQIMALQKDKLDFIKTENIPTIIHAINSVFSIVGPVMAGLLALTVRTRIKRH